MRVWVNARTGKFYCSKSKYFGRTKEGMYFPSKKSARKAGFKESKSSRCK